ncbi:MAG: oligosaccharide flippase family protein [Planctomycetota bacterium]
MSEASKLTLPKTSEKPPETDASHASQRLTARLGKLPELAKNHSQVIVTVAVSLSIFGLMAIHSILLSRLLGPAGRGEYGTAMFFVQTMTYIGLLGTHYSIAKFASGKHCPQQMQRSAFRVGVLTGIGCCFISILLSLIGLPADKQYLLPMCLICSLLLPAEHLRLTAQAVDHGRGNFGRYNLSRLFAAAVFPILVTILYVAQHNNLRLVCWLTVIVAIVSYGFYFLISDNRRVFGKSEPSARKLIYAGLPDGGLVLANDLFDRLAILLVIWVSSLSDQGLYLTAIPIANLLVVAPFAFELFAFRAAADEDKRLTVAELVKASLLIIFVQIIVLAAIQVILQPLVPILFGAKFMGVTPVARILILAFFFSGFSIVAEGHLRGSGLAKLAIMARFLSALVMCLSVFLMPPWEPMYRVAAATVVGHAFNSVLATWLVYRNISLNRKEAL